MDFSIKFKLIISYFYNKRNVTFSCEKVFKAIRLQFKVTRTYFYVILWFGVNFKVTFVHTDLYVDIHSV